MLQDLHRQMHGYLVDCPLVRSRAQRMVLFFVVCLPVLVLVQRPEVSADVTLLALPALRPVTVIQFSRQITIIKRIDVFLAARVPVPNAVVLVIILVAVVLRITAHFWEDCLLAAETLLSTQVPEDCLYARLVPSREVIANRGAIVV